MPSGPLGGPRPGASCTMEIKAKFNNPNNKKESSAAESAAMKSRIAQRAESIRAFNDTLEVDGELFNTTIVLIVTDKPNIQLTEVEDMVSDVESVIGERVAVEIRCS